MRLSREFVLWIFREKAVPFDCAATRTENAMQSNVLFRGGVYCSSFRHFLLLPLFCFFFSYVAGGALFSRDSEIELFFQCFPAAKHDTQRTHEHVARFSRPHRSYNKYILRNVTRNYSANERFAFRESDVINHVVVKQSISRLVARPIVSIFLIAKSKLVAPD